jgi:hypothetical protein
MDATMMTAQAETQQGLSDDDVSFDSVEQLEQAALQIRTEIRQSEMKELADAAELAAEAGQEKFAGRASTFGEKDIPEIIRPHPLKRYSTYSEGTSLLRRGSSIPGLRRNPKIRVLALRHVNEVIPQMNELHMHLRTHLSLNGVDERSLTLTSDDEDQVNSERRDNERRNGTVTPVQVLNHLTRWVHKRPESDSNALTPKKSTVSQRLSSASLNDEAGGGGGAHDGVDSSDTYEFGGMLSGHIRPPRPVSRSPICVPEGLDLSDSFDDDFDFPIMKISSKLEVDGMDGDTIDTVPTSSSSQQERHDLEDLTPVELFKRIDSSPDISHDFGAGFPNSLLAQASDEKTSCFDTPVRLRGMRQASRCGVEPPLDEAEDMDWALKFLELRHVRSDPQLPSHDDILSVPVLNSKSEGVAKDSSSTTRLARRETSSPLNASTNCESSDGHAGQYQSQEDPSRLLERQESMKPALDPPRSLSAGEHTMVELVAEDPATFAESRAKSSSIYVKEGDGNLDIVTGSKGACSDKFIGKALDANESTPPLMAWLVQCQCEEPVNAMQNDMTDTDATGALIYIDEAGENALDTEDSKQRQPLSAPARVAMSMRGGNSPPLLPLLDREEDTVSESTRVTEHVASNGSADHSFDKTEDPSLSVSVVIFENERLLSCLNSQPVISSRDMEAGEKTRECCAIDTIVKIDAHEHKSLTNATVDSRVFAPGTVVGTESPRSKESRPVGEIAEFRSKEQVERTEHDDRGPSNRDGTERSDTTVAESTKERFDPQTQAHTSDPILAPFDQHAVQSEALMPEVHGSNNDEGQIQDINPNREGLSELAEIELPVTFDDDDVRSEDSSQTPPPHPCECIFAVAATIEENVMVHIENDDQSNDPFAILKMSEFPARHVPSPTLKLELDHGRAIENKMSPPRRTLSCPALVAIVAGVERPDAFTISHKGPLERTTSPVSATSDKALADQRRRHFGFHYSYTMDPCQSASPIRETMDDMMQSLSIRRSFDKDKSDRMQRKENHDFLNNYMYCSKPPGQPKGDHAKNFCAELGFDHCEILSGVLDTYRSIVPRKSSELSLDARDGSLPPMEPETWFDIASEHFDGALETLVGRAHAQSRRWNSMFQAPSLKVKKENGASTPIPQRNKGVQGIILVKQSSREELSDQQFRFLYGMTREQFAELPVTERSMHHDMVQENRNRWRPNEQLGPETGPSSTIPARRASSPHMDLS